MSKAEALPTIADDVLWKVSTGSYHDPHSVLGAHQLDAKTWILRALRPLAKSVAAEIEGGKTVELEHLSNG
ncbi:MAG: hypothetical protein KGL77_06540, partial [Actinomycetales bacterium]|nr:hypothetical protein [Actinomycetales bacterium]